MYSSRKQHRFFSLIGLMSCENKHIDEQTTKIQKEGFVTTLCIIIVNFEITLMPSRVIDLQKHYGKNNST